ncbi:hypothetical protein ACIQXV_26755 [Neobacillus sp. NPDC097160]|uniref:hypothetical protein n=1 Tax=Neobacillus sp. NPDC097160 TaxID=3364298 RepID=UPI00381BC920
MKIGQERLENKIDSFRGSIVKDLTPYIEKVEKHVEDSKNEIHERFDRLDRQVRMIDADLDGLNIQVQLKKSAKTTVNFGAVLSTSIIYPSSTVSLI